MASRKWWLASAPAALLVAGLVAADPPSQTSTTAQGSGAKAGCSKTSQVSVGTSAKGTCSSTSQVSVGTSAKGTCSKTSQVSVGTSAKGTCSKTSQVGLGDDQGSSGTKVGSKRGKGGKGTFGAGVRQRGGRGGQALTADQIVERFMAYDKNKDGKITKDELPERLQSLIARGDTNKDGALDKAELQKLAADLAKDGFGFGFGQGFAGGRGPGGRFGGFGGGGPPFGGFRPGGGAERALAELKLTDKQKEKAEALIKTHQESVRKLLDMARSDLLFKMKELLPDQDFTKFKAALDRGPGVRGAPVGASGAGDLQKRLERLQNDVDSLRRALQSKKAISAP
jgi:hypothetical protein